MLNNLNAFFGGGEGSEATPSKNRFAAPMKNRNKPILGRLYSSANRFRTDYTVTNDVLGDGFNGKVQLIMQNGTGKMCALKSFNKLSQDKQKRHMTENEVLLALRMDHPNLCKVVDVYDEGDVVHMVMENLSGGDLYSRLQKYKTFNEDLAASSVHQMLLAINHLHKDGICHRDLKLENFCYESDAKDSRLKLIDFGFAKDWDPNTLMQAACGSISYVSPCILKGAYTNKCDLWSLGVIVFMLLGGYPPFHVANKNTPAGRNAFLELIKKGTYDMRPSRWNHISPEAKDFVKRLLTVEPNHRMSAQQALDHPWIRKFLARQQPAVLTDDILTALRTYAKASNVQRATCALAAWHKNVDAKDSRKWESVFFSLDRKNDGSIKIGDMKYRLTKDFNIGVGEVVKLFVAMDTNNNGVVSYSEWVAAMLSPRVIGSQSCGNISEMVFSRVDRDGTRYITVANLKDVFGDFFGDMSCEELVASVGESGSYASFGVVKASVPIFSETFTSSNGISYDAFQHHILKELAEASADEEELAPGLESGDNSLKFVDRDISGVSTSPDSFCQVTRSASSLPRVP